MLPRTHHGTSPAGKLPPTVYRMGGAHFRQDDAFVASAVAEVGRLEDSIGLSTDSRLLDWGCGAGRLAVGIVEKLGRIDQYHGVDIQKHLVEWAERHLGDRPGFTFTHVDLANPRYNPGGSLERSIPGATSDYDGFYAYSVFSHLMGDDTAAYLHEVSRLLKPGGRAFVTRLRRGRRARPGGEPARLRPAGVVRAAALRALRPPLLRGHGRATRASRSTASSTARRPTGSRSTSCASR